MLAHHCLRQALGIAACQAAVGAHAAKTMLHGFFHDLEHVLHLGQ